MGSKSGGSTTTVQKSDPWSEQKPYLTDQFQEAKKLFDEGKLNPQAYDGNTIADFSPDQVAAQNMVRNRAMQGSDLVRGSQRVANDTLSGKYMDVSRNPAFSSGLKDIQDAYSKGVAAQTDAAFARSGAYGGSAYQDQTKTNQNAYADALNKFAGDMYNKERTNQLRMTQLAPQLAQQDYADAQRLASVGGDIQDLQQATINSDINRFNIEADSPYSALNRYAGLIQGNYGGTNTSTQPYQSNRAAGALGGAATGAMIGSKVMPGWGTAIGALGGGIFGGFL